LAPSSGSLTLSSEALAGCSQRATGSRLKTGGGLQGKEPGRRLISSLCNRSEPQLGIVGLQGRSGPWCTVIHSGAAKTPLWRRVQPGSGTRRRHPYARRLRSFLSAWAAHHEIEEGAPAASRGGGSRGSRGPSGNARVKCAAAESMQNNRGSFLINLRTQLDPTERAGDGSRGRAAAEGRADHRRAI